MSRESDTTPESHVTADPDTIQAWGDAHGMVPVRYEHEGERRLDLVPESETRDAHERLSWNEFTTEMGEGNQVLVRHGDRDPDMAVLDRSDLHGRVTGQSEEAQDALISGETVETQLSERKVVEHTVVEEATVQSEIVDREILQTDTVDVRLLTSEVDHCTVSRAGKPDESAEAVSRFEPGTRLDEAYDVEFEIDEGWTLTRELLERITVESRVVDADLQDAETVESDTVAETVDIEGVQQTVVEGQLVDSPRTVGEIVDTGHVESRFGEDDVIETHLIRRKTVEEEMSVRKQFAGQISGGETLSTDAISHTVVESSIVGEDEYEADLLASDERETSAASAGATGTGPSDTTGTGSAETTETGSADTSRTGVGRTEFDAESTGTEVERTGTDAGTGGSDVETTAGSVTPTADEVGKTVVNADGDDIGMVAEVEDGTMYVDPDPTLADQIRSVLGWTDHDEEAYPVDSAEISRVDDDTVVLDEDLTR